jgi:hypothetical protein
MNIYIYIYTHTHTHIYIYIYKHVHALCTRTAKYSHTHTYQPNTFIVAAPAFEIADSNRLDKQLHTYIHTYIHINLIHVLWLHLPFKLLIQTVLINNCIYTYIHIYIHINLIHVLWLHSPFKLSIRTCLDKRFHKRSTLTLILLAMRISKIAVERRGRKILTNYWW